MRLTKASIATLALPPGRAEAIHFDDLLPGFGIRLRASGKHVWVCQYQIGAQQRRMTLGSVHLFDPDKARYWARQQLAKRALGEDPQETRQATRAALKDTLAAIAENYLKAKQPNLRASSFDDLRRYLTKDYWRPLHKLPLDKVARRDVAACLSVIKQNSGDVAAARALSALSSLYVWSIGEGIADSNPTIGVNKPPTPPARSRVLSDQEIAEVWNACEPDDYGRVIRLLLLTGARRGEVGGMRWSELDPDNGTWTIPGERTKNKKPHTLPLPPLAWQIIGEVHPRLGVDHVFGHGKNGLAGWSRNADAMKKRMRALPPLVVHDLRRSVATGMADLKILPHVIEQILNHQSGHRAGIVGVYNRSVYANEVRNALLIWADHLRALVGGEQRKVIPLRP
jgi:integrase